MVPDPASQPIQENDTKIQDAPARQPAIRTMKTDAAEFFQKKKPSPAKLVGLELKQGTAAIETQRHSSGRKTLTIVISIVTVLAIAAGATAIWFFVFSVPPDSEITPKKTEEPRPFFTADGSEAIEADMANPSAFTARLETLTGHPGRAGSIQHLYIKLHDGPQERFATLADFFALYHITPPPNTFRTIESPAMLFVWRGNESNQFGIAAKTTDVNRTFRDLLIWEPTLMRDLTPLFFGGSQATGTVSFFEDRTYQNIDWRFLARSADGTGIAYAVFPARDVVILTTGEAAMKAAIDRLFGIR